MNRIRATGLGVVVLVAAIAVGVYAARSRPKPEMVPTDSVMDGPVWDFKLTNLRTLLKEGEPEDADERKAHARYLPDAIRAVLAGKAVKVKRSAALGCYFYALRR